MQFELLRLSMLIRVQMDGFERQKPDKTPYTREEWLREIFAQRIAFTHRRELFHYVPEMDIPGGEAGELIVGRIGRQIKVVENEPPDAGLHETERATWRAAMVLIDPRHHADGQKVAVEHIPQIGRPVSLFASLVTHINAGSEPFMLEANAITNPQSFWNFVEAHQGDITSVTFEFIAPNMFGQTDDYDREMRDMKDKEKAQKAKLTIESEDGLNLKTERVKGAVNYAVRGGGMIKARTRRRQIYNSKDKAKKVTVPKSECDELSKNGLITWLIKNIFSL